MTQAAIVITGASALIPSGDQGALGPRRIDDGELKDRFAGAAARRMGRLTRLALFVTERAMKEAALDLGPRVGLVVGTGLADLEETEQLLGGVFERGAGFASPQQFQRSMHSAIAGELSIFFGLTGYNMTVTQGLTSGTAAVFQAMQAIESGRCDRCVCVAADGVSKAQRLANEALGGDPRGPPGEGAAAMVLEPRDRAQRTPLAELVRVDLAAAQAARFEAPPALGVHGALGLVMTALALRAPGFTGLPAGIELRR